VFPTSIQSKRSFMKITTFVDSKFKNLKFKKFKL
jgi:hypothetical protein